MSVLKDDLTYAFAEASEFARPHDKQGENPGFDVEQKFGELLAAAEARVRQIIARKEAFVPREQRVAQQQQRGSTRWWADRLGFPRDGYGLQRVGQFQGRAIHRRYGMSAITAVDEFEGMNANDLAERLFGGVEWPFQIHVTLEVGLDEQNAHVYWNGRYAGGNYPGNHDAANGALEDAMDAWRVELVASITAILAAEQ